MTQIAADLASIGLHYTAAHLDDLVALVTRKRLSPVQILEHLVELEKQERARRSLERRLARGHIGRFKPMADFDWSWPRKIDRDAVEEALSLRFLEQNRNLVLVANQGLGKTMIAQNVAHQAVLAGYSVLFTTASQLLLDLAAQESARALERRLRHYSTASLLGIDEVGYLSYDSRNADLLFQVISRRYERKSLILTTNLAFSDWPTIFPNSTCATALIDRVVHHCEIIAIDGDSYRRREAEASKKAHRNRPKDPPETSHKDRNGNGERPSPHA
jgi:DNA replication protein DnaC